MYKNSKLEKTNYIHRFLFSMLLLYQVFRRFASILHHNLPDIFTKPVFRSKRPPISWVVYPFCLFFAFPSRIPLLRYTFPDKRTKYSKEGADPYMRLIPEKGALNLYRLRCVLLLGAAGFGTGMLWVFSPTAAQITGSIAVALFFWFFRMDWTKRRFSLRLTPTALHFRCGIWFCRKRNIPRFAITGLRTRQTLLGRLFRVWSVTVYAGTVAVRLFPMSALQFRMLSRFISHRR